MYEFCVLTPTCNRPNQLERISNQLQSEAIKERLSTVHCIVDDSSDPSCQIRKMLPTDWYYRICKKHSENYGRYRFWEIWNELMNMTKDLLWKWVIAIPDDHLLCRNFLIQVRSHIEKEKRIDPRVCAVNILVKNLMNWGMENYVDGAFIADRRFFEGLGWKVEPPLPNWWTRGRPRNPKLTSHPIGSGVGRIMSLKIASSSSGVKIAKVQNLSFLKPMDIPSVMFPPEKWPKRPRHWGLSNFIEDLKRRGR